MCRQTPKDRTELTIAMLKDENLTLTFKEVAAVVYHHIQLERYIYKRERAKRLARKHGMWLNNQKDIYALRKDIKKLKL